MAYDGGLLRDPQAMSILSSRWQSPLIRGQVSCLCYVDLPHTLITGLFLNPFNLYLPLASYKHNQDSQMKKEQEGNGRAVDSVKIAGAL